MKKMRTSKARSGKRRRRQLPAPAPAPQLPIAPEPASLDSSGLTPRERRFVVEYLVDLNATRAAIRAGYSPKTARQIGSENLTKPDIRSVVDAVLEDRARRIKLQGEDVFGELVCILRADLRRAVDEHGRLLPLHELPEDLAAAISSIEVNEIIETQETPTGPRGGMRKEKVLVGYTTKVKLWDKNRAAELLGKALRMWKEQLEHSGPGGGPIAVGMAPAETEKLDELLARVERVLEGASPAKGSPTPAPGPSEEARDG